ncbi:MAG: tRNA (mo5U34)-methyltransferase [Myxococcota bacterium]|nr:tRNA (mo5U34)-methyltransferase [Myxococcota bacterium]
MKRRFLDFLDASSQPWELIPSKSEGEEVIEGQLKQGARVVKVVRGMPRFVPDDNYAGNFSFQWQKFKRTQSEGELREQSRKAFWDKTGFDRERDIAGKLVLDVGCGQGRFADFALEAGAEVVGVDLSFAVESAYSNMKHYSKAHIAQANVFELPFKKECFDTIYSLGVLHHTPDCKAAFEKLIPLLKPGGRIAIWVYGAYGWNYGDIRDTFDFWRSRTVNWDTDRLMRWCRAVLPLYHLQKNPTVWKTIHNSLPGFLFHKIPLVSASENAEQRLLDTFDFYGPKYQSLHTYPEVFGWFKNAGLTDIHVLEFPVCVIGTKPA